MFTIAKCRNDVVLAKDPNDARKCICKRITAMVSLEEVKFQKLTCVLMWV